MATEFVSNFSWHTATAIVISIAATFGLRYLLKKRHPQEYESLRFEGELINKQDQMANLGHDSSGYKPDNSKHHFESLLGKWLLTFGFLKLHDIPFTIYCLCTQVAIGTSLYFVLTEPIFAEWSSKW